MYEQGFETFAEKAQRHEQKQALLQRQEQIECQKSKIRFYCIDKKELASKIDSHQNRIIFESTIVVSAADRGDPKKPRDPNKEEGKKVVSLKGYGDEMFHSLFFDKYPKFYVTFNTFDGKKQVLSVNNAKEIESIVLEYKSECVLDCMDGEINKRMREIKNLREERRILCDLIDNTFITDNKSICDTLKEMHPRFYEMNSKEEMNREFELINEQIFTHACRVDEIKEKLTRLKDGSTEGNPGVNKRGSKDCQENISITLPHGTIGKIKSPNGSFTSFDFDCYWMYKNDEQNETNMKKRKTFVEIDDDAIKKRYVEDNL